MQLWAGSVCSAPFSGWCEGGGGGGACRALGQGERGQDQDLTAELRKGRPWDLDSVGSVLPTRLSELSTQDAPCLPFHPSAPHSWPPQAPSSLDPQASSPRRSFFAVLEGSWMPGRLGLQFQALCCPVWWSPCDPVSRSANGLMRMI